MAIEYRGERFSGYNKPKRKPINASTKKTLQSKAAGSKYTYGQLSQVYRRGQGAYLSGGSKSASMQAWAMGLSLIHI